MTEPTAEPDNPTAYALARHIADHPVSTIQAAFRYLNAPLGIELHEDPAAPAPDQAALRDRIADALRTTPSAIGAENPQLGFPSHHQPGESGYLGWCALCVRDIDALAAAVLAVLPAPADRAPTLRELEQQQRPNTPPSRPEPRLPDHTVTEEEAPTPVRQRADCTELEWAEQERARFERLYTRETVRADLAEQRADTAARDADIYQKRLERLSEGYTEQRKRAEAMERAMESTAVDALAHRGCHRELMAQCLRAERAEAEVERLRADRANVLREEAALIRAHCPDHLDSNSAEGSWMDCHCAVADDMEKRAAELRRVAADTGHDDSETEAPPVCQGFVWIGQPFTTCDRCGQPAWEHAGEEVPVEGAGPFDSERTVRPWKPGQADAIRAKWAPEQPAAAQPPKEV